MLRKIIVTEDNSKTLLIEELNETYHSTKGAIRESMHVFIQEGLETLKDKSEIHIFEMGLGTGLNILSTLNFFLTHPNIHLIYKGIEKYPLEEDLISALDYSSQFNNEELTRLYNRAIQSEWNLAIDLSENFELHKIKGDLMSMESDPNFYDIIYYDAFGPKVQPELWSEEPLRKMFDLLKPNGILVTYCAQGQFKRNLKAVGFEVQTLPGPPGKREMVRATKL